MSGSGRIIDGPPDGGPRALIGYIKQLTVAYRKDMRSRDGDPEVNHHMEDGYAETIIRAVAEGKDMAEAARAMVKLYDTDRVRWYA